jgi:outer membrane protein assembly factor BamA
VNIYSIEGSKIASYKDKSTTLTAGFGLTFGKSFNIETSYNVEYMRIRPGLAYYDEVYYPQFNDILNKLNVSAIIDNLDDTLLPRHGYHATINYEGSFKEFGSVYPYTRFDFSTKIYQTFLKKHTFMLYGFYGKASKNSPIYKLFYHGGPETFVGLDYTQLVSDHLAVARVEYRYEIYPNLFVKFLANTAFIHELRSQDIPTSQEMFMGYGIGIKFRSILGPLEYIVSRGELSPYQPGEKEMYFYFRAGYKF